MSRFITFLDTYYSGWKLYPVKSTCGQREDTSLPIEKGYKKNGSVFPADNASPEVIEEYRDKAWICKTGPRFISKIIRNTIQNDNLSNSGITETYGKSNIDEKYHFKANGGYANGWLLDFKYLETNFSDYLQRSADGGYDLEFIVEFQPQKIFYVTAIISVFMIFAIILYLLWCGIGSWIMRRSILNKGYGK